jgi:hypothetical protein
MYRDEIIILLLLSPALNLSFSLVLVTCNQNPLRELSQRE